MPWRRAATRRRCQRPRSRIGVLLLATALASVWLRLSRRDAKPHRPGAVRRRVRAGVKARIGDLRLEVDLVEPEAGLDESLARLQRILEAAYASAVADGQASGNQCSRRR